MPTAAAHRSVAALVAGPDIGPDREESIFETVKKTSLTPYGAAWEEHGGADDIGQSVWSGKAPGALMPKSSSAGCAARVDLSTER
jgi:hypothetical protein